MGEVMQDGEGDGAWETGAVTVYAMVVLLFLRFQKLGHSQTWPEYYVRLSYLFSLGFFFLHCLYFLSLQHALLDFASLNQLSSQKA